MILEKCGESLEIEGRVFTIGDRVLSVDDSEYGKLYGTILEIRTDPDKDTENEDPDIYVCFDEPEDEELIKELEVRFSELYREPKTIDEIGIDLVIMAPEELILVNK